MLWLLAHPTKIRRRSVSTFYIWHLALADLLLILTLPFLCYATATRSWIFGTIACKAAYVVREINKFTSVHMLAVLSIDRCLATYPSLRSYRTPLVGRRLCITVWLLALLLTLPYWSLAEVVQGTQDDPDSQSCRLCWPGGEQALHYRQAWTYTHLTLALLLPFTIITLAYALLLKRIRATAYMCPCQVQRHNARLTKTCVIIVMAFLVCHLPYYVMEVVALRVQERKVWYDEVPSVASGQRFMYVNVLAQILVFISSCCNPVLYGLLNTNIRKCTIR